MIRVSGRRSLALAEQKRQYRKHSASLAKRDSKDKIDAETAAIDLGPYQRKTGCVRGVLDCYKRLDLLKGRSELEGRRNLSIVTLQKLVSETVSVPALFAVALLLLRAVIMTTLELMQPANDVPYRRLWWRDGSAWIVYTFAIVPIAFGLNNLMGIRAVVFPAAVLALPLALRFLLFTVLVDLGYYWVHRLMHTRHVWRVHKWHHTPTHVYWLSGVRASLLQQTLADVPFVCCGALLDIAPWWMVTFMVTKAALLNDWMHLNVPWGNPWLEWIVVTPRYHRIHHSDDPAHYRSNLATLLPIWDRLFGTYVNPGSVSQQLTFGINERVSAGRLALGV